MQGASALTAGSPSLHSLSASVSSAAAAAGQPYHKAPPSSGVDFSTSVGSATHRQTGFAPGFPPPISSTSGAASSQHQHHHHQSEQPQGLSSSAAAVGGRAQISHQGTASHYGGVAASALPQMQSQGSQTAPAVPARMHSAPRPSPSLPGQANGGTGLLSGSLRAASAQQPREASLGSADEGLQGAHSGAYKGAEAAQAYASGSSYGLPFSAAAQGQQSQQQQQTQAGVNPYAAIESNAQAAGTSSAAQKVR